jgi:basic membrane protein A
LEKEKKMKRYLAILLAALMVVTILAGCGGTTTSSSSEAASGSTGGDSTASEAAPETKVYNVVNLVNGNLGDKSFFDSCESGLAELQAAGRITYTTIEMGGTDADQPTWKTTLEDVSASGEYDLIICGTYQMPDYLNEVAAKYPDQKYLIYDSESNQPNVANINYKQNDMGYLVGTFAAAMTTQTDVANINADKVIGFVGGVDSPVINDFLYGFITGAQAVDPEIKIDTRYVNSYVDTATAKELALSMINDNNVDIVWGVAGLSGNGAAEAALESGKAYFIGVDSDQELTLSTELAAITLTSGLKNIGQSLIWFFDEWDAGTTYWGQSVLLGLNEGGVGIVTDKNYATIAPQAVQDTTNAAIEAVASGEVTVPTAIGDESGAVEELRESVRP